MNLHAVNAIIFDGQISGSYAFNANEFETSKDWQKVRELFINNYHSIPTGNIIINRIPKKIHQIWLGSEIPEQYARYAETWQKFHPDWDYKLWTDEDVKDIELTKPDVYYDAVNPAMKSDILRYEVLRQHGGLYVDTDFECLKSFEPLRYLNFFTGIGYDGKLQLYNGLIASIPHHPILEYLTLYVKGYKGSKGSDILNATGANFFTQIFNKVAEGPVVAFPTDFFYPLSNKEVTNNPYEFVKPCSYAIHHWAVSWTKKRK